MSEKAFTKIIRGLGEAKSYMDGEREEYKVTVSSTVLEALCPAPATEEQVTVPVRRKA